MVKNKFFWKTVDSMCDKAYFHDSKGKILGSIVEFTDYSYKAFYDNKLLGIYIDTDYAKQAVEEENSKYF